MTNLADITGNWTIDPSHSRIGFVVRHAMVTKVRGAFNEFDGSASLDGSDVSKSSATVTIKVDSIDTRNAQRDGHLRSGDFFAIDEFPEITFVSTSVEQTGPETANLTGDLTIKGVTKSVAVPFEFVGVASDPMGNDRAGFEGGVTINRKDFGMTYNAAMETGGVLISDKVDLEFEISAIKQG